MTYNVFGGTQVSRVSRTS